MNKPDFISKWSNFWRFQPNYQALNSAFAHELNQVIAADVYNATQNKCCMACTYWRPTSLGNGGCDVFSKYTTEDFYCKKFAPNT